jgi:drug/metabolite transporter superfamily protein YnfA
MMNTLQLTGLFFITAVAEIVGCYLFWLVAKQNQTPWLLLPGTLVLVLFAYLLTLHPSPVGVFTQLMVACISWSPCCGYAGWMVCIGVDGIC